VIGELGLYVKDAVRTELGATTTTLVTLLESEALVTTKDTAYEPAAAKAWLGFWSVLVEPSLKFQLHEVGLPLELSVNWTI
jgi:hypothetical protein